ncbi:MAG TPA: amphi-Trp domain-containing protein [Methyloceanibacter sp.]|nr:amphi-Trp domain-containing protein [Methyloceanibacter sp.]
MPKEKMRASLTRDEAAEKLEQFAQQLRKGSLSFGEGEKQIAVAGEVEFKADLDKDKLEVELKWET